jgi:Ca-activated chloride channel family protein
MGELPPPVDDVNAPHVIIPLDGARLTFDRPAWLLLLLVAPWLFAVLRRSLADFSAGQLILQGAVRTLVVAGVAAALAGPSLRRPARAVSAVVLVDVSDSVPDAGLLVEASAVAAVGRAAAARGDLAPRVVRFAAGPEEIFPTGAAPALARFSAHGGAATDLALAVGLGAGLVDTAALPRLLLISDGLPTRGDLPAAASHLADRGIPIFALPLPAPDLGDAAVIALSAPDDVRPRVPFRVEVRLLSDRAVEAQVKLEADARAIGPAQVTPAQVTIDAPEQTARLAPGETTVGFTARIAEPGTAIFRARVATAADRHPENDQGVLAVATLRDARALCLEGTPAAAASLSRALAAERIASDVRPARALGAGDGLERYDLVVLADVPRAALSEPGLAALEAFVRGGGGLIVGGGTQSFGPGGYLGTRLEGLLPVRLDVPHRDEEASLALALVIDKSGSMAGPKMDLTKQAARATAETLPPSDQIAVVVFDSQATAVVQLQRAENRQRILGDIGRIAASGGTNILAGLREAVEELLPVRARKKHIILLSDGQSPYDEIPDLVDAASAARITISAVGVGEGADQTMLKMIATRGGGRFYETRDPASIPRIFSHETSDLDDQSIVERPTTARVSKRIAALTGVAIETAPPLGGYVVTRPRAQAETPLATADGAPLLARWQVGLGQVTAWTSDLGARWGAAWARWPPYDKLWAQIARATMRRRAASHFPIRSTRQDDQVRIIVDAIGADDRFVTGLDGQVQVSAVGADGRAAATRSLPFPETAPGRYEATFRPDIEAGALLFSASFTNAGAPTADASGRLTLPFAPELTLAPPSAHGGAALLATAAARSGGRLVSDPVEVLDPGSDRRETRRPLRTPILLATLALFVVDVLFRRIRLPQGRRGPAPIDSRR